RRRAAPRPTTTSTPPGSPTTSLTSARRLTRASAARRAEPVRPWRALGVESPAERRDVAARHRHLRAVAHDEHGGAVELRTELDGVRQVDEEGAVHAGEAARLPVLLELAERRAQQEAAVVADDPRVVAVGLGDRDRLQAHE